MKMKENMFYGAGNLIFERAKKLRNNFTPTEIILLPGSPFRGRRGFPSSPFLRLSFRTGGGGFRG